MPQRVESKYYYIPVDDYYTYCMRVAKEYSISPKEVYDTWSVPMLLVTFVSVFNNSLTEYAQQQEAMKSKKPEIIHVEKEYIRNITPEMIEKSLTEHKEETKFAPEQEYLRSLYERN